MAAAVTGSAAMFAETLHSPDERHPFGHGKNVYFWAFIVSMMLFTLGGAFAIWEAVRQFLHPHPRSPSRCSSPSRTTRSSSGTAPPEVESRIRSVVSRDPAVDGLEALHTMHLGPDALLIALAVAFRRDLTAGQVADAVGRMQQGIGDTLSGQTCPMLILIEPTHRRAA